MKYYCGVDIGTRRIKAGIIKVCSIEEMECIQTYEQKIHGFKEGAVTDLTELTESIHQAVTILSKKSGIKLKEVQLGIHGGLVEARAIQAVIPLADKGNKVIARQDIKKVNRQARLLGVQMEEEVLHDIPREYYIDGGNAAVNPLGLHARQLAVNSLMMVANVTRLHNIIKAVNQAGYEVAGVFFSSYVAADIFLNERQKKEGCAFVDISSMETTILIFKEGQCQHLEKIQFGGNHFTRSIAERLNLSFDLAEDIKKSYASVMSISPYHKEEILVKKNQSYIPIRREEINQSVESGLTYLVQKMKEVIEMPPWDKRLNAGVIMVGGGALLPGLIERVEGITHLSARLGKKTHKIGTGPKSGPVPVLSSEDMGFASVVGLALNGYKKTFQYNMLNTRGFLGKTFIERARDLYEEYF